LRGQETYGSDVVKTVNWKAMNGMPATESHARIASLDSVDRKSMGCHRGTFKGFVINAGRALLFVFVVALSVGDTAYGQKKPKLDKTYREWLDRDVVYIITKPERDDFLLLTTNDARDKFIEQFWEIRNPDAGSPTNSYKEDIYRRIAFADARFGIGSGSEG
jgi:hypothetical protein